MLSLELQLKGHGSHYLRLPANLEHLLDIMYKQIQSRYFRLYAVIPHMMHDEEHQICQSLLFCIICVAMIISSITEIWSNDMQLNESHWWENHCSVHPEHYPVHPVTIPLIRGLNDTAINRIMPEKFHDRSLRLLMCDLPMSSSFCNFVTVLPWSYQLLSRYNHGGLCYGFGDRLHMKSIDSRWTDLNCAISNRASIIVVRKVRVGTQWCPVSFMPGKAIQDECSFCRPANL